MIVVAIAAAAAVLGAADVPKTHAASNLPLCVQRPQLCTEQNDPWSWHGYQYVSGHDEPSLLFYSTVPGSGNSVNANLTLPTDPAAPPKQDGTGSTWNFQLRPAFWFGMIMCDDQDAPNPGVACPADSDKNIFKSTNPKSADYLGLTPGQAYMEMQFYPPGWGPVSCTDANGNQDGKWCSALTIDSVQSNSNTGVANNATCNNLLGPEPVNYAIVTKSGVPVAPASPDTGFGNQAVVTADTLEYNNGDKLTVDMHDTPDGFQVVIHDLTTGQSGSMTASTANGFGHALFQPTASTCTMVKYAYHPMFSTSGPSTRNLWAAHSYNVAFSDEIGHFEYCNAITNRFRCAAAGAPNATDPTVDSDDFPCFPAPLVDPTGTSIGSLTGCVGSDNDFDGPEYQNGSWPGSPGADPSSVSTPVQFTSPLFTGPGASGLRNYQQAAFEADLPRIEGSDFSSNNTCQRHVSNPADPSPGTGCVNPPNGATFYPIFSTTTAADGSCLWQEGGGSIPGSTNTFGGNSAAEYGGLLLSPYPAAGFTITERYNNFQNVLASNPCPAPGGKSG
ncbi:MAG TPA: hypothetical protein VF094_04035 [Gaiellaceae bacterium]